MGLVPSREREKRPTSASAAITAYRPAIRDGCRGVRTTPGPSVAAIAGFSAAAEAGPRSALSAMDCEVPFPLIRRSIVDVNDHRRRLAADGGCPQGVR